MRNSSYIFTVKEEIEIAAKILTKGGIILYPTDTIWGLGCDLGNDAAVAKILKLKGKDARNGLIVLVHNQRLLKRYVKEIPDVCYDLIDFSEDPITIIYPRGQYVADQVMGEDGSLAVRLTKNEFCSKLMERTKFGLVSTSANISGEGIKSTFDSIPKEIKLGVDHIVNLPKFKSAERASKIIKIGPKNEIEIIRK